MRTRYIGSLMSAAVAAAAVSAVVTLTITRTAGQGTPSSKPAPSSRPARVERKPNFSGIWQANNEANWNLESHAALPGMVTQQGVYPYEYTRVPAAPVVALGSVGGVP